MKHLKKETYLKVDELFIGKMKCAQQLLYFIGWLLLAVDVIAYCLTLV